MTPLMIEGDGKNPIRSDFFSYPVKVTITSILTRLGTEPSSSQTTSTTPWRQHWPLV